MKTQLNEKITLPQLNAKGDKGNFSHRVLRSKLIAEKHFNPKKHKKGKFYFDIDKNKKYLMVAYADLKGVATYVPMLTVGQKID